MPPRTSWKGFIKLSLVSVPVKAFTANDPGAQIRLNQLHCDCNSRIAYKKVCPVHGEVGNDQIARGYEHAKGQYVVIEDEELGKLRTKSDHSVNIEGFVAPDALDPVYHAGRTYYLLPDGAVGQKPYRLLVRGMQGERGARPGAGGDLPARPAGAAASAGRHAGDDHPQSQEEGEVGRPVPG